MEDDIRELLEKELKRALEISRQKRQLTKEQVREIKLDVGDLSAQIDPLRDLFLGIALSAALLKDLLDMAIIGSLIPGFAQIITFCCLITVPFCMFLMGGGGIIKRKILKKLLIWLAGFLAEFIPVLNFFPIGTATVIILYILILRERRLEKYQKNLQAIVGQETAYTDDYEISYPNPSKKAA